MVLTEISDIIDQKLNTFDKGVSVDEYEKSLYLTSAQTKVFDELIRLFEIDGDLSKDLEPFIKDYTTSSAISRTSIIANSISFPMPADLRKPVYEAAVLSSSDELFNNKEVKVIKTKLAELSHKLSNSFRLPNYEEILRVVTYDEASNSVAELIMPSEATTISSYKLKYIEKLTPIVLEALPDNLEIEGVSTATNSKFNTEKLDKIIDLAIGLILRDRVVPKSEV